jgi:aquaporin Z
MFKKGLAEVLGTFFLVFIGTGTAVLVGDTVGVLGIGLALPIQ